MSTGLNAQQSDASFSNLTIRNNAVVGQNLVSNHLVVMSDILVPDISASEIIAESVISDSVTAGTIQTVDFQMTKEPIVNGYVLVTDDLGVGSWGPVSGVPGLVSGSGTTGRLTQWIDGPNSDLGDSLVSVTSATMSPVGAVDIGLSATTTNVNLSSANAVANAIQINALNGGIDINAGTNGITIDTTGSISIDAALTSNISTTTGTMTIASTDATGSGQVVINSSGTGLSAVDINAIAGGITMDYESSNVMSVKSGGTDIATFGTQANPDVNVTGGNLIFFAPTKGIKSGPTSSVVVADAVTVDGTAGVITDSGVVGPGSRATIMVTNSTVIITSQIFIQVTDDSTAGQSASLLVSVTPNPPGMFSLNVFNTDSVNPTNVAPSYQYLIINPS